MRKDLKQLLHDTNVLLKHQKKVEELKGESFNIFQVLGVETKENKTHSAFLGELLNRKGSHLKGTVFLKMFLEVINCTHLDPESTRLKLEHYIGKKNNKDKTGGRVDIFLKDAKGNSLCIENKIYAGDQVAQIERYCNYRKYNNRVYYLNLDGKEPKVWSRGKKILDEDYQIISYDKEILRWLAHCQKECADTPILRETIKQYSILIKKLTSTMDNSDEKELFNIILKEYNAAAFVAANFEKARRKVADDVRLEIALYLEEILGNDFKVVPGEDTTSRWSKIWINIEGVTSKELKLGVENFNENGHRGGDLFFGVYTHNDKDFNYSKFRKTGKINSWWANPVNIRFEENEISFGDLNLISKLNSDKEFRRKFVSEVAKEIKFLVENEKEYLKKFKEQYLVKVTD